MYLRKHPHATNNYLKSHNKTLHQTARTGAFFRKLLARLVSLALGEASKWLGPPILSNERKKAMIKMNRISPHVVGFQSNILKYKRFHRLQVKTINR